MATQTLRKIDDRVSIDDVKYPGVWIVKAIGPKNYTLVPTSGGRALRCPHYLVIDPVAAGELPPSASVQTVIYGLGELIRIANGKWAGLWVVIADRGGDKVNLAKLGGDREDGHTYLRHGRRGLIKVDPADVLTEAAQREL